MAVRRASLAKRIRDRLPIDLGNYPYVTARVKAKKALLLTKTTYDRFLKMSIPEIARVLGEGQYNEEIRELATRYSGVDLVEMATRNNLAKVFHEIIEFSEGPLKEMIAAFLDRWDVWNIKTVLRGRFYGATDEEILEDMIPAGSFPLDSLRSLIALETLDEVVEALEPTIYGPVLMGLPPTASELTSLAAYEDLLDKVFYEHLLETVPPTPEPSRLFHNFIRREIDLVNLQTLLRVRGIEGVEARQIFINGGLNLSKESLSGMMGIELPALVERLRETPFHEVLSPYLTVEKPRIADGIRAMEKWHLKQAATGGNLHPLSVLPVLDYLVRKTNEVGNVRIISRGKASGLDEDTIREMLVI